MIAKLLVLVMLIFLIAPVFMGVFVLRRIRRLPRPAEPDREE